MLAAARERHRVVVSVATIHRSKREVELEAGGGPWEHEEASRLEAAGQNGSMMEPVRVGLMGCGHISGIC